MDAIGLAASIIQFIDFSSRLAKRFKEETDLKSNAQDYMRLSRELESLYSDLETCRKTIEKTADDSVRFQEQYSERPASRERDSTTTILSYLNETINHLKGTLVTVERTLPKQGKRQMKKWKLLGTQKTFDSATESLRQSKETVSLLLTMLEIASKIPSRHDSSEIGCPNYYKDRDMAILDWLTSFDYRSKHIELSRIRATGTGNWLLKESLVFQSWSTGAPASEQRKLGEDKKDMEEKRAETSFMKRRSQNNRPSNVLWCHGSPGSGKSVLMSRIVDHQLARAATDKTLGVAYFYFDFCTKASPRDVLASLLKQLYLQKGIVAPSLIQLWELRESPKTPPTSGELLAAFLDLASKFRQTYVCLDALDECTAEYQHALCEMVLGLMNSRCFLIITSRPDAIYMDLFKDTPKIAVKPTADDIKSYVAQVVEKSVELADMVDEPLQNQIAEVITEKSNGLFLFAVLQMQHLLNQTSVYELKETLNAIPTSLNGVFDNVLEGLKEQSHNRASLALRILMWLSYSARTLTVPELQHALAIDTNSSTLNPERIPPARFIEEVCMELVTIDKERNAVLLAHASLKHYLVELRNELFPNGKKEIALACLTYMKIPQLSIACATEEDYTNLVKDFPLAVYVGQHWGTHMIAHWKDEVPSRVDKILADEHRLGALAQLLHIGSSITTTNCMDYPSTRRLHIVAFFGMLQATKDLLREAGNIETDSWGRTALHLACEQGHADVAAILQEHENMPLNAIDKYGRSALHYACIKGNLSIVTNLLSRGVAASIRDAGDKTALEHAAENGHASIVPMLLEISDKGNALSIAATAGQTKIVSLLLDAGFDSQEDISLLNAARAGFEDIVGILLERGADLDARDDQEMTALHHAASEGRTAMAKLLLMNGCDVQARDRKGRTALYFAAGKGDEPTVRVLVESGAQIEARTNEGRTALVESAAVGNVGVVDFLLWRGASIGSTSSGESSGSEDVQENALQLACDHGHLAVVKLLLEKYSDPDGRGSTDRTPLSYAAQKRHTPIVELLLATRGVDPNAKDSNGRTALSYAAANGDVTTISLLLTFHSDPNSQDVRGRTPLSYAVETGNEAAVRMLLGKVDADPSYRDRSGMSLLDYARKATGPGKYTIIEILEGPRVIPPVSSYPLKPQSVSATN